MSQLIARIVRKFATYKPIRTSQFNPAKDITSDVVVYTNNNESTFRWLFTFAGLNFICWLLPGVVGLSYLDDLAALSRRREKAVEKGIYEKEWWEVIIKFMDNNRLLTFGIFQALATGGLMASGFFSTRSIHKLVICKGGEVAKFYTWFPVPIKAKKELIVPIKNVSALTSREDTETAFVRLKIKGRPFYFLMDKRVGKFVNPTVFDKTIAFKRNFK